MLMTSVGIYTTHSKGRALRIYNNPGHTSQMGWMVRVNLIVEPQKVAT